MIEQGIVKKASESFHEESQNEAIKNVRPPSSESEKLISKTEEEKDMENTKTPQKERTEKRR